MITGIYNTFDYFFGPYYEKMLLNAVIKGDIEQAKAALLKGANINYQEPGSLETPLHKAASQGNTAMIKFLLSKEDIRVNEVNNNKETPLHKVAVMGNTDIVLLLISKGAKINAVTNAQLSALDMLILNDKIATLKELIQRSKSTDSTQYNNLIAIILKHDKLEMALDFINHPPSHVEINQNILLEYAVKHCSENAVKMLLSRFENIDEDQLNKLLNIAVKKNNNTVVNRLIAKGANSNNESTPLLFAAEHGYFDIVHTLIKVGAKLNSNDINGDNILHIVVKNLHLDIFKSLLHNSELNFKATNAEGMTVSQLISSQLSTLRHSLHALHKEFQNKLQSQVQQFNKKDKQNLVTSITTLDNTLIEQEQAIFEQIEKLIVMQTLLNNVDVGEVPTTNPASPLKLILPVITQPEKINLDIPTSPLKSSISPLQSSHRVVGGKSKRPEDFTQVSKLNTDNVDNTAEDKTENSGRKKLKKSPGTPKS